MKHTPFLKAVANHYNALDCDLSEYCFVFPNRRSSKFFANYLCQGSRGVAIMPQVTTITDFIADITESVPASPIESLFTLYQSYVKVSGNTEYAFDRFVFWGNIILKDFNDCDMYLVDAEQLFQNTKELREISTDYMTPELKAAIERFFNVRFDDHGNEDRFWRNFDPSGNANEVKQGYLTLWQQLYTLYLEFGQQLESQGLSYRGKMMRDAVKITKNAAADELGFKKTVMVGFNVLSTSELAIFDNLNNKRVAEFCWDYNSCAFDNKANQGTRFLDFYLKRFPNAINEEEITTFPQIDVVAVPSNIGQAKYAFHVVDHLIDQHLIDDVSNAIDTAIVLPDENLFMPLLNSASSRITNINVTLGYPLRDSDIVSLMRIVAAMHRKAYRSGNETEFHFYRDDVKAVLSHPVIKSMFTSESTRIISDIDNNNLFRIPESRFAETGFHELFMTIRPEDGQDGVIAYINHVKTFVERIDERIKKQHHTAQAEDDEQQATMPLQRAFIHQYLEVLDDIQDTIDRYGVPMVESTVFFLIDRLTALYTIPFQGEPLHGLQIMGVLETRCLDFKNLIMLSMNERVFPRKFFSSSFIPMNLRKAFNMSTIEHQEAMTAYYFYRLISRAEHVTLVYDSSEQSIGSGEHSRYITQLELAYGVKIHRKQLSLSIKPSKPLEINVPKTGRVARLVDAYSDQQSTKSLSASSIKTFIKCPLKFYFTKIERLNDDNEETEFMDAATFGSIVHDTLQQFYYPDTVKPNEHYLVYSGMIKNFKKQKLNAYLKRNINRLFMRRKDEQLDVELTGEAAIIFDALHTYVCHVLDYDLKQLENRQASYFEVYECEMNHNVTFKLPGGTAFNFTYKADRIDKINGEGALRLIDYKTGRDETAFRSVDDLFDPSKGNLLAILQLFIYCNAYANEHPVEQEIQPIIYKLRNMDESGIKFGPTPRNQVVIEDFRNPYLWQNVNEQFLEQLKTCMDKFFDHDTPFSQCENLPNRSPCPYCKFVEFCRR